MSELAAVCFDLDGTLCESEQDVGDLLAAAFDDLGRSAAFGSEDVWAVDTSSLPTAESDREFYRNLFEAAARRSGASLDAETVDALAGAYLERYDPTAVRPRAGALDALEAGRERYPVALVTNGGRETQAAKLERLGVADAFDATVYCDPAAGIEPKPDPAPLERALEGLGADAERSLLVGDSLGADVAGAHAVGMQSAWVPLDSPAADPTPEPTHVLESMRGVPELL